MERSSLRMQENAVTGHYTAPPTLPRTLASVAAMAPFDRRRRCCCVTWWAAILPCNTTVRRRSMGAADIAVDTCVGGSLWLPLIAAAAVVPTERTSGLCTSSRRRRLVHALPSRPTRPSHAAAGLLTLLPPWKNSPYVRSSYVTLCVHPWFMYMYKLSTSQCSCGQPVSRG